MRAKKFLQGDKSAGICAQCKAIVSTTYRRRDVPFASGIGMVRDILVAICDICGSVVSTPSQSTPAIKAAYKKIIKESKLKRQPVSPAKPHGTVRSLFHVLASRGKSNSPVTIEEMNEITAADWAGQSSGTATSDAPEADRPIIPDSASKATRD